MAKASALYKKIVKIQPDDDAALRRTAELSAQQGLSADARMQLQALFQQRLRRGDAAAAADAARAYADFRAEMAKMPADRLTFADSLEDRVAAYFHTGGTTGMPKVAQHKVSGMIYNGWLGVEPSVQAHRRGDVPAAPVPRLRLLSDPDVDDRLGRACRVSDPAGLSRRGRVRQPVETGGTLQGHLPDHRADRPCCADAAPGQCRYLQPEERLLRLISLADRTLQPLQERDGDRDHRRLRADRSHLPGVDQPAGRGEEDRLGRPDIPLYPCPHPDLAGRHRLSRMCGGRGGRDLHLEPRRL